MNDIAHTLYNIVQYILGFGPTVMLPLVLFILALFFKVKPAKALRSSLTVGIGFVGIYAIFDILTSNVGPAAQAMVERTGINLPVVDLGLPPLSAITWGSPIAPFVIPLTILINVAMLALNKTRTVDVDMWNYWHFALAGTLVYYSSGSLFFGLLAAAIAAVVVLKLADWSAPLVQKYFGTEGSLCRRSLRWCSFRSVCWSTKSSTISPASIVFISIRKPYRKSLAFSANR